MEQKILGNKIKIEIGDRFCFFQLMNYTAHSHKLRMIGRDGKPDICHICKKIVEPECQIYLVCNNYLWFPNCVVHKSCIDGKSFDEIFNFLTEDFNKAKEFEHWFK